MILDQNLNHIYLLMVIPFLIMINIYLIISVIIKIIDIIDVRKKHLIKILIEGNYNNAEEDDINIAIW